MDKAWVGKSYGLTLHKPEMSLSPELCAKNTAFPKIQRKPRRAIIDNAWGHSDIVLDLLKWLIPENFERGKCPFYKQKGLPYLAVLIVELLYCR